MEFTVRIRLCFLKQTALLLPLLIVVFTAAPVSAQETENQFWPEIDAYVRLSGKTRLFFIYSATRLSAANSYSDGKVGGYLDFHAFPLFRSRVLQNHRDEARNKSLMIRVGYLLDRTPRGSDQTSITHMPTLEGHVRFLLPGKMLLSDRNRLDFRIVDGDYRPQYRNRLKVERAFKHNWLELTPYAHYEFFYSWHNNMISRTRFTSGMEWTLNRRVTLEGYYARQRNIGSTSDSYVNAVGLVVQFYFR
jgi:hypothetical protein